MLYLNHAKLLMRNFWFLGNALVAIFEAYFL